MRWSAWCCLLVLAAVVWLPGAKVVEALEPADGGGGEAGCQAAPAPMPVADPERNLDQVEAISNALKEASMKGICAAIRHFDLAAAASHLTPQGRFERLFPQVERPVLDRDGRVGGILAPRRPGCFGGREEFLADLDRLSADWIRVDQCSFKPFRIFATQERPRRALVDLHLWLNATERSGARVAQRAQVQGEAIEDASGVWRFTRLVPGEWEWFRADRPAFADRTEEAGLPTQWVDAGYEDAGLLLGQRLYGGVAVGDYDGDGWSDLYVARAGDNLLLRNDGQGGFEDVTARAGVGDPGNGQSALWADLDNDGDLDLFVVNASYSAVKTPESRRGHYLYRNEGDGTFTRLPEPFGPAGSASGAVAADYDNDGLLDIYVLYYTDEDLNPFHHFIEARDGEPNHLFRNLGGLRFEDVTEQAGVDGSGGWAYGAAWADYDEDGHIDLYLANDYGDNTLYRNLGDGTFEDVAARAGVLDAANGMSADWGDYDNDGRLDLYIANMFSKTGSEFLELYQELDEELSRKLRFSVEGNSLYRNLGDGTFEETARTLGATIGGWAWGSNFLDFDNDGWLDIHVANGFWAGRSDADA